MKVKVWVKGDHREVHTFLQSKLSGSFMIYGGYIEESFSTNNCTANIIVGSIEQIHTWYKQGLSHNLVEPSPVGTLLHYTILE